MSRDQVQRYLCEELGLDPARVGVPRWEQVLDHHRRLCEPPTWEALLARLQHSPHQHRALSAELVVPESWFFRDEEPYYRLPNLVLSGRWGWPLRRPLRVLSVPCAGGEEPYSLAIALLAAGVSAAALQIDAVDVNTAALNKAQLGQYGKNSFRNALAPSWQAYFHTDGENWQVSTAAQRPVRFRLGDLLASDFLANEEPYDVIWCRNLFIYFTPAGRDKALDRLSKILAPGGVVFSGHAEPLAQWDPRWNRLGLAGSMVYEWQAVPASEPDLQPRPTTKQPELVKKVPGELGGGRASQALLGKPAVAPNTVAASTVAANLAASSTPLPAHRASDSQAKTGWLEEVTQLADRREYAQARSLCERGLQQYGPSAAAYFLLSTLQLAQNDHAVAEATLRKVLYLEPQHSEALLALSLLVGRRGDAAAAERLRDRSQRAWQAEQLP